MTKTAENPNEVRLDDISGHAVYLNKSTGQFIVRYKRDTDFDNAPDEDEDGAALLERTYDSMDKVHEFIDRRYESLQKAKKQPLNIPVLSEYGRVTVKAIHGGTGKPIFTGTTLKASTLKELGNDHYSGEYRLYPVHPTIERAVAELQALGKQEDELRARIEQARKELKPFAISKGSYSRGWSDDAEFKSVHDAALAAAKKAAGRVT